LEVEKLFIIDKLAFGREMGLWLLLLLLFLLLGFTRICAEL
jgi:hypothetical protein